MPGYGRAIAQAPEQLSSANRLLNTAVALEPQWEWLLGLDAPRRYLVLVQNNHELRATGGFLSAFGTVVVDQGQIADLAFVDSYDLFSTAHEYPPAPAPMQEYMGIQLLTPRDGNWSPDLPTAAETIRKLYTQETGQAVDGIITVDLDAVRHLVKALGSVQVEGVPTPITAENVEQELVQLWEQPPGQAGEAGEHQGGDKRLVGAAQGLCPAGSRGSAGAAAGWESLTPPIWRLNSRQHWMNARSRCGWTRPRCKGAGRSEMGRRAASAGERGLPGGGGQQCWI